MNSFVIWIKTVALISVLLMNICRADMTLDEVESTLQFEITTDSSQVVVNPEGPLNFLRGLIYQKMECMYNKRFFSPEINTKYSLEEDPNYFNLDNIYMYNRDKQMDKAYTAQLTNKMDVYSEKYHNHLIELFPSPTGDITIETRGNQSFVQFLLAKTTKKHSLQILAMLLLFSEGVNIPIRVNNTILEVYETDKKDKIYFEVSMEIPWLNIKEDKVQTYQQKKVKQLISFFKKNATNREVLSLMKDKCSQEEIAAGKFLNSLKFLIQSYIFGFIDTEERATKFIQTVHTMTEKYAPKTEAPSKGDCVYDRLFKPASTATGTDCMALMKKTQEIVNMYRAFPFLDSTELPAYTSVPRYNREAKEFSTNSLENYSNCVDCMILSLFCCLAYDPVEKKYRTDHMGNVSDELKEFFAPEENKSFDTTKAEFQKDWSRVVADLKEASIAYCKGRNELDCGIINMLMVIAEVVNASEEEKKKILGFSESLKEKNGKLENELSNAIQEYTKTLLTRLSKTKGVEVQFSELRSIRYGNGRYDVFGKITMSFEQSDIKNTIVLCISKGHSSIGMLPTSMNFKDDRMEKLDEILDSCKNVTAFVENLFALYVGYEMRKIGTLENNEEFMKQQVRKTINNNFVDINRLLLMKKINAFEYAKELVTCSTVYTIDQELSPQHPLIRFMSNIIGNMELDNLAIQTEMLLSAGSTDPQTAIKLKYPRINLSENSYNDMCMYFNHTNVVKYLLDCDVNILRIYAKCFVDHMKQYNLDFYRLLDSITNRNLYKYIFRYENMECAKMFVNYMIKSYPDDKEAIITSLHFIWIVYLCSEKIPNEELIKANFRAIHEYIYIKEECNSLYRVYTLCKEAIHNSNSESGLIYRSAEDFNKFDQYMHVFESRQK
ncbi:hypothetical protein NEAUS03_1379 [Nematocida ausubeli]|nr:hypothetical protein NEAUS03_1379 [Nematocida ausubeli]